MRPSPRPFCDISQQAHFYGEELSAPHSIEKLEDHPLSAVCDSLFNIVAVTLHPQPENAPCRGDKGHI
jgi:hypothetical protein